MKIILVSGSMQIIKDTKTMLKTHDVKNTGQQSSIIYLVKQLFLYDNRNLIRKKGGTSTYFSHINVKTNPE